jgi:hypothetical protein
MTVATQRVGRNAAHPVGRSSGNLRLVVMELQHAHLRRQCRTPLNCCEQLVHAPRREQHENVCVPFGEQFEGLVLEVVACEAQIADVLPWEAIGDAAHDVGGQAQKRC